jgi:hypothetical protein
MSIAGLLLGIINIAIVVVILVLIGALVVWFLNLMQWPVPWNIQRLYLAVVALIALYMLVALLLGMPTIRLVGPERVGLTPVEHAKAALRLT